MLLAYLPYRQHNLRTCGEVFGQPCSDYYKFRQDFHFLLWFDFSAMFACAERVDFMKYEAEIREILIQNTIHLVAEGGFEMATTRAIATEKTEIELPIRMNEVYIYRLFGGKARLYEAAFICLDEELFSAFRRGVESVGGLETDTKEHLYAFFMKTWNFLLCNEERCRCYVQYYYSVYFKGHSLKVHKKLFDGMTAPFHPLFKDETDTHMILHSMFTTILDFAIRVYNDDMEDNEKNRRFVFNVLYYTIVAYLKPELVKSEQG